MSVHWVGPSESKARRGRHAFTRCSSSTLGVVGKCRRHKFAKYSTQGNVDHFRHTQLLSSFAREAVSGTRGTSCLAATSDAAAASLLTALSGLRSDMISGTGTSGTCRPVHLHPNAAHESARAICPNTTDLLRKNKSVPADSDRNRLTKRWEARGS